MISPWLPLGAGLEALSYFGGEAACNVGPRFQPAPLPGTGSRGIRLTNKNYGRPLFFFFKIAAASPLKISIAPSTQMMAAPVGKSNR